MFPDGDVVASDVTLSLFHRCLVYLRFPQQLLSLSLPLFTRSALHLVQKRI